MASLPPNLAGLHADETKRRPGRPAGSKSRSSSPGPDPATQRQTPLDARTAGVVHNTVKMMTDQKAQGAPEIRTKLWRKIVCYRRRFPSLLAINSNVSVNSSVTELMAEYESYQSQLNGGSQEEMLTKLVLVGFDQAEKMTEWGWTGTLNFKNAGTVAAQYLMDKKQGVDFANCIAQVAIDYGDIFRPSALTRLTIHIMNTLMLVDRINKGGGQPIFTPPQSAQQPQDVHGNVRENAEYIKKLSEDL